MTCVTLCLVLLWGIAPIIRAASEPDIDRAEQLSWMDAPSALHLLDRLPVTTLSGDELVHWLMIRGLAYADGDQERAEAIIRRLHELGGAQPAAEAASRIVQGHLDFRRDRFAQAEAQLKQIGADDRLPAFERYRLQAVRGNVELLSGKHEAALSSYERLWDMANVMHSPARAFEAMSKLCGLYTQTGNLERAATLVAQMRVMAGHSGDDLQWVEVLDIENDIAEARGDRTGQERALLEALRHARLAGGDRSMAMVLIDLGALYLKTGAYAESLRYSKEALAVASKLQRRLFERLASFSLGMAQIGLGHLRQGKPLVDHAIQQSMDSGDLFSADQMLHEYLTALEKAADLRGALEVAHRDDKVREQLAATSRQNVILELSAKFDDERRARQIDLLKRNNAIKSRDLQAQRLREQMIVMASALVVLACGALAWGITRIRRINARWVQNSQRDALTGALNRRYFNEHTLIQQGDRPYVGCLLLINVDHFQRINDVFGHAAGDAVLAALGRRLADTLRDRQALVRWAGEEFLALLSPMSEAQLNLVVHRLLAAMRAELVTWNGHSHRCTVSVGYAGFPMDGATVDISLDRAITLVGKALRQAKRQGRDRACRIKGVNANDQEELSTINVRFEEAAAAHHVQLVDTREERTAAE